MIDRFSAARRDAKLAEGMKQSMLEAEQLLATLSFQLALSPTRYRLQTNELKKTRIVIRIEIFVFHSARFFNFDHEMENTYRNN